MDQWRCGFETDVMRLASKVMAAGLLLMTVLWQHTAAAVPGASGITQYIAFSSVKSDVGYTSVVLVWLQFAVTSVATYKLVENEF
jgi:hypothetical protein